VKVTFLDIPTTRKSTLVQILPQLKKVYMVNNIFHKLAVLTAEVAFGLAVMSAHFVPTAKATVLTFDDITKDVTPTLIPNGYGGLNWENFGLIGKLFRPGTGFDIGTVSGEHTAFNEFGAPAAIKGNVFSFNGTYFTSTTTDFSVQVKGYLKNKLVGSKNVTLNNTRPTWFDFDFFKIDQLIFDTSDNPSNEFTVFAMDNFAFNESPSKVPEPSLTLVLLIFGAFSIYLVPRRLVARENQSQVVDEGNSPGGEFTFGIPLADDEFWSDSSRCVEDINSFEGDSFIDAANTKKADPELGASARSL
jgi:hypothetical protein